MKPHSRLLQAIALLCLPNWVTAQESIVAPQPLSIAGATAHIYKSIDGTDLRLHVFPPSDHSAAARRPAILFFFGGGWNSGTVLQFVPQSRHIAARGMVAIVADYRVFARHKTSAFEAMADAKSAIRWVRVRARELGIDPMRIAAAGGSSGGHIALSAAVFDRFDEPGENPTVSSKPNALVLLNPVVDTSRLRRFGKRGTEGSPHHHLGRGLPPTIIVHGKADTDTRYVDVERFCAKARRLGAHCSLVGYDGAPHGFFNLEHQDGRWFQQTLLEIDRFLTGIGYLPPAPARPAPSAGNS